MRYVFPSLHTQNIVTVDGQVPHTKYVLTCFYPDVTAGRRVLEWVLQDVVVFARLVGCYGAARLNDIFARYEELRRKRIDAAYDEANLRWDTK